ncbi:undecaprenyldiphospho-muramoylpentapeptide beta-N-acetylglucosaminyltransferase [Aestuariibacter sp. AA17]|uniref:UDP-N-acetylglucosamine--N-acetylmuramyl-(pentapeptide) pyrophosphoryl-undecaprenol N-acetylglucosamine transferase n=1 Tax=Fluctibacter corallii TaxID=2984329 RepID=A0ABT3A9D4_9ALTE|nr:undecaprenyldiphospho-muramoylpentapeptide beta-N-acetylglucosaminyltransferase [Aestuariibacter sp. AA17]MCV2884887.1 undecaprenyldiphospho-muramoylpentapeptide beta-N-acetylglucosaminyltransferase [Aestuariibacter sp. AA17]
MPKRLLVMAGGTGGHVFPGLAVADKLAEQGWQIEWLGTEARLEATLVPKAGYKINYIDVAGVRGNGLVRKLKAPIQILKSIFQARTVIKHFQPDVVLGMGGFASGPGGIAAWCAGKPLVLHEQNAVPGLTNKVLAKFANKVLMGFDHTFPQQSERPEKFAWVGNPVRKAFSNIKRTSVPSTPIRILVVGGSLGAKALNDCVPKALASISSAEVRHQCGNGHQPSVIDNYQAANLCAELQWQVVPFIDDMAEAYAWADLVICRAGALTVAEVAASGIAAVFVPLPHAVDDHQTKNAKSLSDQEAAFLLPQKELIEGGLVPILERVVSSPETLFKMGQRARALARYQATEDVANVCNQLAGSMS